MSQEKTRNHDERLPDVEIISNGTSEQCKVFIDGVDYTKKLFIKNIKANIGVGDVHTITIEFYADNVSIKTKAKVEKQCVKE
ncbi:hypothetical protein [Clostridium sp.]|jgi:hypothetical protein|uniref:hypothetical protein n=1 Tax=Clostridium sp. TaxID=1506 RepID=UPI003A447183